MLNKEPKFTGRSQTKRDEFGASYNVNKKIKKDSRFLKRALPVNIELYQHNKSPANLARLLQAYKRLAGIYTWKSILSAKKSRWRLHSIQYIFSLDVIIIDLWYLFLWKYSFFYSIIFSFSFLPSQSIYSSYKHAFSLRHICIYSPFICFRPCLSNGHKVSMSIVILKFGCILVVSFS